MITSKLKKLLCCGALILTFAGCKEREVREDLDRGQPVLQEKKCDCLIVVVLDLSGSYRNLMLDDGRAYRFFLRLVEQSARRQSESNDRIVIAQLSAEEKSLLFDGTPTSLRKVYPSASAFRKDMMAKSNPNGSRVHDAIADALQYALDYPGVANGQTKSMLLVLSDMEDNAPEPEQSKARLLQLLTDYARAKNSVVGMYWVDQKLTSLWRQHLKECGIKNFVIESNIVPDPPAPKLGD